MKRLLFLIAIMMAIPMSMPWLSSDVHAGCVVELSQPKTAGFNSRDINCDTALNQKMTLGTLISGENLALNAIFVVSGPLTTVTTTALVADADNAQTNAALVTVSTGTRIAVTRVTAKCHAANTVSVNIKVGFGLATLPADSAAGAVGVLTHHPKTPAGGGFVEGNGGGILGIGADGEDVRFTMDDPVTGSCSLSVTYFTF